MNLSGTIFIILFFMAAAGWAYAFYIRYHPMNRTWIEVVIGVGGTVAGETSIIILTLLYYNLLHLLWWLCLVPLACYIATGHSQIIQQELKVREEARKSEAEKNNHIEGFDGF